MNKELAKNLISAGVHFGHASSRWNPKMEPYIFGKRNKIHVIDVKETLKGLLISQKALINIISSGKDVVFVGTKRQAQKAVEGAAAQCGMHYVSERWLGGTLTNFQTIRSRLKRLEELEAMDAKGLLAAESKKQEARLKRELRNIKTNLDGIRKMSKLPGIMVVVDTKKEHLAIREAKKLGIVTIGLIDTDSDPDEIDIVIPSNDDSLKAIEIILGQLAEAVSYGKTQFKPSGSAAAPKRRSKRAAIGSAKEETSKKPRRRIEEPSAKKEKAPAAAKEDKEKSQEAPAAEKKPETPAAEQAPEKPAE